MLKYIIIGAVVVIALVIGVPFAFDGWGCSEDGAANSTSNHRQHLDDRWDLHQRWERGHGDDRRGHNDGTAVDQHHRGSHDHHGGACYHRGSEQHHHLLGRALDFDASPQRLPDGRRRDRRREHLVLGDSRSGRGAVRRSARFGSPDVPERLAPILMQEAAGDPAAGDPLTPQRAT